MVRPAMHYCAWLIVCSGIVRYCPNDTGTHLPVWPHLPWVDNFFQRWFGRSVNCNYVVRYVGDLLRVWESVMRSGFGPRTLSYIENSFIPLSSSTRWLISNFSRLLYIFFVYCFGRLPNDWLVANWVETYFRLRNMASRKNCCDFCDNMIFANIYSAKEMTIFFEINGD